MSEWNGWPRADINKLADWMMANGYATGHGETMEDLLDELKWQIEERIAIEREACAKVCDKISDEDGFEGGYADFCAQAIRKRGQG